MGSFKKWPTAPKAKAVATKFLGEILSEALTSRNTQSDDSMDIQEKAKLLKKAFLGPDLQEIMEEYGPEVSALLDQLADKLVSETLKRRA
jgi:hypothetical protein